MKKGILLTALAALLCSVPSVSAQETNESSAYALGRINFDAGAIYRAGNTESVEASVAVSDYFAEFKALQIGAGAEIVSQNQTKVLRSAGFGLRLRRTLILSEEGALRNIAVIGQVNCVRDFQNQKWTAEVGGGLEYAINNNYATGWNSRWDFSNGESLHCIYASRKF